MGDTAGTGTDFIQIDQLDPDSLSLDLFGADDLLNQGNNLVNYSGFDAWGNKLTGDRPTLDEFFNEANESGDLMRPIAAYEPIYISGYVMDKFTFDDIIFNVGIRVDRFDANQDVLKDPYVIGDSYTVNELKAADGLIENELDGELIIPDNIGGDYVVYVDALENPNAVVGYRDGDTWYNALGSEINDPDILAVNEPYPAPWLVGQDPDAELTKDAFRGYTPAVNIMPLEYKTAVSNAFLNAEVMYKDEEGLLLAQREGEWLD